MRYEVYELYFNHTVKYFYLILCNCLKLHPSINQIKKDNLQKAIGCMTTSDTL